MAVRELVALRIDVGLNGTTGHAEYPNFNKVSTATRKGMDWSKYLDVHGSGMHYDKTCGHQDETAESPHGHQCCHICVPADFAAEALILFPKTVHECTDAEFEAFYNNKAHAHEPDEVVNTDALNGLAVQRSLMVAVGQDVTALDARIAKALDPADDSEAGVKVNKNRTWALAGAKRGITVKKVSVK